MEDYVKFVEEMVAKWGQHSQLLRNDQVSPFLLNKALAEYQNVNIALIGEYHRHKSSYTDLESEFQAWWDEKFITIRARLNTPDLAASKWASTREIEAMVRVENKAEYGEWKRKLTAQERKVSFYRSLVDSWKRFDGILTTIANNMRSELKALSIGNRANRDPLNEPEPSAPQERVRKVKQ